MRCDMFSEQINCVVWCFNGHLCVINSSTLCFTEERNECGLRNTRRFIMRGFEWIENKSMLFSMCLGFLQNNSSEGREWISEDLSVMSSEHSFTCGLQSSARCRSALHFSNTSQRFIWRSFAHTSLSSSLLQHTRVSCLSPAVHIVCDHVTSSHDSSSCSRPLHWLQDRLKTWTTGRWHHSWRLRWWHRCTESESYNGTKPQK